MPLWKFAGILTQQLLEFAQLLQNPHVFAVIRSAICTQAGVVITSLMASTASSSSDAMTTGGLSRITDSNSIIHLPVACDYDDTRRRVKPRRCCYCSTGTEGEANNGG